MVPRPQTQLVTLGAIPATIAEFQEHGRIGATQATPTQLARLLRAATTVVEGYTDRCIMETEFTCWFPEFRNRMVIPRGFPGLTVTAVKYLDLALQEQTLDPSVYLVNPQAAPGEVTLAQYQTWPSTYCRWDAVRIEYKAGVADPADVPDMLKLAVLMTALHMFENPGFTGGSPNLIPGPAKSILGDYQIHGAW